jgi:hypothetical protein
VGVMHGQADPHSSLVSLRTVPSGMDHRVESERSVGGVYVDIITLMGSVMTGLLLAYDVPRPGAVYFPSMTLTE